MKKAVVLATVLLLALAPYAAATCNLDIIDAPSPCSRRDTELHVHALLWNASYTSLSTRNDAARSHAR